MAARGKAAPSKATKVPKLRTDHVAGLAAAIAGKDALTQVIPLSDDRVLGVIRPDRVFSTRSIAVDRATRIGGFPGGRLVEVFGLNGSGKTTLVLQTVAELQSRGGVALYLDSENKLDRVYAAHLGVDVSKLLMIQPEKKTMEATIQASDRALSYWLDKGLQNEVPLGMFWDSVGNTATEEELENPGSKQPGVAAKLLKQAMRTLTQKISRAYCLFVVTNQLYDKIGAMGFGPKRSTFGGEGLRYQATMRLEMIRTGFLKVGDKAVGIEVLVKFLKNHAGSLEGDARGAMLETLDASIAIQRGFGVHNAWSVFDALKEHRYITSGGAHYTFQIKGGSPVRWQGAWQGLDALWHQDPGLRDVMQRIYMGLS